MNVILDLQIIDSPAMGIVYGIAVALALVLLIRRATPGWVLRAVIGIGVGGVIGVAAYLVANATDAFGANLSLGVAVWAAACLGGVGLAIVSLWDSAVWRKIVAGFSILWFLITAVVGINAAFGINPTLGSLFGVVSSNPIDLGDGGDASGAPDQPIYQTWKPPADMPAQGERGTHAIPGTVSGFTARDAGIYLPPAALTAGAPALPLVIMMMGHPGNPDVTFIGDVLDQFAAQHNGLAPIVIVADQLGGDGTSDPACSDSTAFGNAETYVTQDVVNWARANLHIIDDPAYVTVAGYSNGGGCAIKYGSKYPDMFKNIIDVSGEEYPGSEDPDDVTASIYGGDSAAFEASKSINIMQAAPSGSFSRTTAVFTAGSEDPAYISASQAVAGAAAAVGMATTLSVVEGADHGGTAVSGGLTEGFDVLYPVLGLSAP